MNFLPYAIVVSLAINLILILIFLFLNLYNIIKYFKDIRRTTQYLLIIIFLFAIILRLFIMPHFFRHGFEGDYWYTYLAKEILYSGTTDITIAKSPAWSLIIALSFFLFGEFDSTALILSAVIGSLSIFAIFALLYSMTKNEKIGTWAAFLLTLSPLHLDWSRGGTYNVFATFLMLVSFSLFFIYLKNKKSEIFGLAFFLLFYIIQISSQYLLTPFTGETITNPIMNKQKK